MNNDDNNAQENAGGGAQANGVGGAQANVAAGAQANAGGVAQANGVGGAQANVAAGAQANAGGVAQANGVGGAQANVAAGAQANAGGVAQANGVGGAQENVAAGAQANVAAGAQANAGGGAQANGVGGAQANGVSPQANGVGGPPVFPVPNANAGGPHANGLVAHDNPQANAGGGPQANAGSGPQANAGGVPQVNAGGVPQVNAGVIQANVNRGLAGFNHALQRLDYGLDRMNQGMDFLEFEAAEAEAVEVNRPAILDVMRACLERMTQAAVRIQGSINDIAHRFEFEPEVQVFPAEVRQISVTARMISTSALAIHSFLVYNADCHIDDEGGHGNIQDGLAHANLALAVFQHHISRFLGYEPPGYYSFSQILSFIFFFHQVQDFWYIMFASEKYHRITLSCCRYNLR
ncbi:hypothetical protein ACLB2K_059917 [Fragaria x ananassa]